jgi:cation diffusion facilitator family transporter
MIQAVQVGRLPPDEDHPYGHGKFEAIGSLFLSLTLIGTGFGVGAMSFRTLLEIVKQQQQAGAVVSAALSHGHHVPTPGITALVVAAVSIVSKEWLYRVTKVVGERIKSQVVIANAWHHRSDAYSSILALISIGLTMFVPGLQWADAAAGFFVAIMIGMTGVEIMGESIKQLTDSTNEELVQAVTALAVQNEDVQSLQRVRARHVGSLSTVDVSVVMPSDRPTSAARIVEERLRQQILQQDGVIDADVRVTSPGVVCPLLVMNRPLATSVTLVESTVRDHVLQHHPAVSSVPGVTVHFYDTNLIHVNVDIRLINAAESISSAGIVAEQVRETLERLPEIEKASIFLDLNSPTTATTATGSSRTTNEWA